MVPLPLEFILQKTLRHQVPPQQTDSRWRGQGLFDKRLKDEALIVSEEDCAYGGDTEEEEHRWIKDIVICNSGGKFYI